MGKRKSEPAPVAEMVETAPVGDEVAVACGGCGGAMVLSRKLAMRLREMGALRCDECMERDKAEVDAQLAREQHERFVESMRKRAGVPLKWRHTKLGDLDYDAGREAAITAAGGWAEGTRRRGLLFHGPVGRGKTAIAAGAANGRLSRGLPVRWLAVAELLMDLRMPFGSTEYVRAQRALDPRGTALVLDDLDKVRPSEFAREPIYVAVNAWVEAELPLIVTMNRGLEDLEDDFGERYGAAVASRLAGYCDIFEVGGEDRRVT